MLIIEPLVPRHSDGLSSPYDVPYLSPVLLRRSQQGQFLEREAIIVQPHFAQDRAPDVTSRCVVQLGVSQRNMDTRLEGRVECLDPVGGEEEDAFEISVS
jgi:hypothetical protein